MSVADFLPPHASGLKRFVEGYLETVTLGVARFRRGGAHFNAPASTASSILNALLRLLRLALLILACRLEPGPLRPCRQSAERARRLRLPGARFALFPPFRRSHDEAPRAAPPPGFARRARDPVIAVQRKLELIARVLANPKPYVARMARRLPDQLLVIGWRPPRRTPRGPLRDIIDSSTCAWREAWHQLHEFRRRTFDSANPASAS